VKNNKKISSIVYILAKWLTVKQKNIKPDPKIYVLFMFELDDECKIIRNETPVIKETCSWLPPWLDVTR